MIIIQPVPITAAMLTASNVPETDAPAWTAGTYTIGQQRIYDHRVYEVIVSSTTARPDIGAVATPPTWLDLGATNRFKMFDQVISTQTVYAAEIDVEITPAAVVNSAAFFGMLGSSITLTMTDPVDGLVYTETRSLQDNTLIIDWYPYFFEEIAYLPDTVFLNLPAYGSATLNAVIDGGAGNAKVGEVVIGKQRRIGVTNFGSSVSILDYSIKSTDDFGNTIIVQRAYSKRADYDVTVETSAVAAVQKALADIRTTPTVFVGDENRPETVVYGFYKQFNIVLSTPSISDCSIEVEGLV
jgi:hypothetical protein